MKLSKLNKLGPLPVRLEGKIYTAPYSQKPCVWFNYIYSLEKLNPDWGYTRGHETDENNITVKSDAGDLTDYPNGIMLYLATSFDGKGVVDGKDQYIWEFCLELDRQYYAFAEKFTYYLPPILFIPRRRRSTLLLSLSDTPFEKGSPLHPLIPTRQGRTG